MTLWWLLALVAALAGMTALAITALKAKWGLVILGLLLTPIFWWIGAIRLAKPNSIWARHRYDDAKRDRAQARFAEPVNPEFARKLAR
jgi:hypothetical protein